MAQDPDKPKDNGKIGLPKVGPGMTKIAPQGLGKPSEGKGGKPKKEKKTDEEREQEILARIKKRLEACIKAEADNRTEAIDDMKFLKGDQWPQSVKSQRMQDSRPCLTVNKMPTFLHQVTNEQRQNRPSINIHPVGSKADKEAAKMFRGMIRAIERRSRSSIAYDKAFEQAAAMGWGYFQIGTEYERDNSFDQTACIWRIRNPFTVYFDPNHQEPEGSDCEYQFKTEMMPRDEFKREYPDADPMSFTVGGPGENMKNWINQDNVRVAEYWEITHEMSDLVALDNGITAWKDELHEGVKHMIADGKLNIIKERKSSRPKVMWYKVSGVAILEEKETIFENCPIIKVIGDEIDIEGKVTLSGIIRNAKDPQRALNYWTTMECELIALAPKAPFLITEGQIEGHETEWRTANTRSSPVLTYKPDSIAGKPCPPPQRQPFAQIPAGVVNAKQEASQDMMATTGIRFDATKGERFNQESGLAIKELRRQGDINSFHYQDNLVRAMEHAGNMLVKIIPKLYDTERVMMILREDGEEESIKIDPTAPKGFGEQKDPKTGKTLKIFNPSVGEYGVTVTTGPSYSTRRLEAAASMLDFARMMPNVGALISDLIAKNMDWEGSEEIAARLAKAIPPNLLTPEQKDVPPQVQALMQHMDKQIKQLVQERQQLIKQIQNTDADRALMQNKVDKDFEAKVLQVVERMEEAQMKTAQKADEAIQKHVGSQLQELGMGVKQLMQMLGQQADAHWNASKPVDMEVVADLPTGQ